MTRRPAARGLALFAAARLLGAAMAMLATVVVALLVFELSGSRPLHIGLGYSTQFQEPVASLIARHVGPTVLLLGAAGAVAWVVRRVAARLSRGWPRADGATTALWSAPSFWIALGLLVTLGVGTGGFPAVFPAGGLLTPGASSQAPARVVDVLWHLALPCASLSLVMLGLSAPLARRAPPAARVGTAVSATVAIEVVFSWPGLGDLAYQALQTPDLAVLQGTLLTLSALAIVTELIAGVIRRSGADEAPDRAAPAAVPASRADRVRAFLRTPQGFTGTTVLLLVVAWTLAAPLFVHGTQLDVLRDNAPVLHGPTASQPLGTDETGRGELALVLWGGRSSLAISAIASVAALGFGVAVGAVARRWPAVAARPARLLTDWGLGVGTLPLATSLAAVIGSGDVSLVVAVAATTWAATAHRLRVQSTRGLAGLVCACAALALADALVCETTLSFLGLGDPFGVSWGAILNQAFVYGDVTSGAWWTLVFPGAAILVTVLALRLCGRAAEGLLSDRPVPRREPTSSR